MTAGQKKTALVLVIWLALQLVLGVGLLAWEGYAVWLNDDATITEVIQLAWAAQPWVFLVVGVIVTGIVAFLAGHFFAAPSGHYDRLRGGRSLGLVLLASLAGLAATCGPQGRCGPGQVEITVQGLSVCVIAGSTPPVSVYPSPEVTPEPSSTPEPSPTPRPSPPPSPQATPTPDVSPSNPPESPESSPSPKPCVTPSPEVRDPNRAPCQLSQQQLGAIPCWWGARQRLDWEAAKDAANRTWDTDGRGLFWPRSEGSGSLWAVRCRTASPWDRCEMVNGQHAGGPLAERIFGPDYDPTRGEVGNGVCSRAYLESLCPPATAPPACDPTPGPPVSPTPPPAGPNPKPTPATCPPLVRWGGGLHAQMTPQFQGLPKDPFFAGNTADIDSTARFGGSAGGRGKPCNDEHHAVCEADGIDDGPNWRRCEDPRGPVFTVTSCGVDKVKVINGGWGLRLIGVHAGRCCVKIEPRDDVQDHEGQPVRVLGDASTEACFEAR